MDTLLLKGQITSRRELIVHIPPDTPPGQVQVLVFRTSPPKVGRRARRQTAHPAFGIWAKRKDISDSAAFALQLRQCMENRGDGNRD